MMGFLKLRFARSIVAAVFALPMLVSCTTAGPADVDTARIRAADREPGNWLSYGRNYEEQRFSPVKQITEQNVGRLGLAWYYDYDSMRGLEGTPVVVDGVIYSTGPWTVTVALDARTGRQLWRYDPQVPREWARYVCCDVVSRGLAVYEGKVLIATLDGRLIAIDARNGKPLWETLTVDNKKWPYSITGAPRVFNGKVVIGNGGAELGVRGSVSAYDVNSGKLAWRFWTVPGNPADGPDGAASDSAMAMAVKTWSGEWWKQGGGGTAWDALVYDAEFNRIYIGVGNGSPWPHRLRSDGKGDNLFLASIVAVDADTGQYAWHYQQVPGENWDFTSTMPIMMADLDIDGRQRKVLMQAPKNGFFYVIDRTNGKLISAEKFVPNNWASHIDLATGRPAVLPGAYYGEDNPILLSPNNVGAHSWQPMSFNPQTGLVYFPVLENWSLYEQQKDYVPQSFRMSWGAAAAPSQANAAARAEQRGKQTRGWLVAWDPVRQKEVWRTAESGRNGGGTLSTAGNLVFQGNIDKQLVAYRATDGGKLWSTDLQTNAMAAPISYTVDGEQYITVNAGTGTLGGAPGPRSGGRLLAFKLDGKAALPPLAQTPPPPRPPASNHTEEQIRQGAAAYLRVCAQCHGRDAIPVNAIPDLRFMSEQTRGEFKDIVLKGTRTQKGMIAMADLVTEQEADSILGYVMARGREDWSR
jgi:quinohemoprotein ethanol dehydrogenase